MRNSSLVEWLCAENLPGLSIIPKLRINRDISGRGAYLTGRSQLVRVGGQLSSENAGMSNDIPARIRYTGRPRVPGEG